ncbi:MAG: flippase-like domain-containing protein [Chloroflexi bacterium]|nr:flippase-like domain-containing protein [Chloroflexota bacterium]
MEGQKPIPDLPVLPTRKGWPWLRLSLSLAFGLFVLWYVARQTPLAEIGQTLAQVKPGYFLLSLTLVVVTILVRAWRWHLTFQPPGPLPGFRPIFWSLTFGQLLNLVLPFRMGDIARLVKLESWTHAGTTRTLGTIVVEKALDMAALGLSLLFVLPLATVFLGGSPWLIAAATLVALIGLYLLAYQGEALIHLSQKIEPLLPPKLAQRGHRWLVTGLGGLDALRYQRANLRLVGLTGLVSVLSIATPLVLFPALPLSLGLGEAILLHVVLTIGSVPSSTPLNVGIFEGITILLLRQFGVMDDAVSLTYAFLWHMALVLPQVTLGGIAAALRNPQPLPSPTAGEPDPQPELTANRSPEFP